MDSGIILSLSSIAVAVISGVFAYFSTRRVQDTQDKKVDADAFARAQQIYASTLSDIERQLKRLREENAELMATNQRLQKQLYELEQLVSRMRRDLLKHGIPGWND